MGERGGRGERGSGQTAGARARTAARTMVVQSSVLLVSMRSASTYVSEKRTTWTHGTGTASAGRETRTGTWHSSPAWRSPTHTS